MSVTHRRESGAGKELEAAVEELRGRTAATAGGRPLTTLEKLALMAEAITEQPAPSEEPKRGYMWKRYYDTTGVIMWEEVPDPDYSEPEGSYTNPIQYAAGMTVNTGKWYTDGENVWEALKNGVPLGFDDPEYFDIITTG